MTRPTPVTYTDYLTYVGNRPYATVRLRNGSKRSSLLTCLVDTGADFLLIPSSAATSIGLMLPATTGAMATLGGTVYVYRLNNCIIEIEGTRVSKQTVLLDPSGTLPPVVGRDSLLAFCELGFNTVEWLWK